MLNRVVPAIRELPEIAATVLEGLTSLPKWLPPKLFYDHEGSLLFERITELPEYYLTRTERGILSEYAEEIISQAGNPETLVELGAGSASKTTLLLDAAVEASGEANYIPIDVSGAALRDAQSRIRSICSGVNVQPIHAEYAPGLAKLPRHAGRKLVLFIGSSIGNFELFEAARLLSDIRRSLSADDAVLLGTDMRKSLDLLIPAYDDAQGVTAAFNKNLLRRINRELGAGFKLSTFAHRIRWNDDESRIEMHLESLRNQSVPIEMLDIIVNFCEGETIHTENSTKFSMDMVDRIVDNAGLRRERTWFDQQKWFGVHLLRR
ncbi:MAG TPA: L-histidine N(alpha)-methyltransferase [Terriglobales bacterium]|nr:L-histidine N(alpha)-methyltransferase [Terriglobales bacterium]